MEDDIGKYIIARLAIIEFSLNELKESQKIFMQNTTNRFADSKDMYAAISRLMTETNSTNWEVSREIEKSMQLVRQLKPGSIKFISQTVSKIYDVITGNKTEENNGNIIL